MPALFRSSEESVSEAEECDDEKGGYKFSIELAAKEASDTITAKVYDGSGSAVKKETSDEIENTRNLGKALYLYNQAAVAKFGE